MNAKNSSGRRPRRAFTWSKEVRDLVRNCIRDGGARFALITALANLTGYPRDACLRFARQMGFGNKRFYREWSEREKAELLRLHAINTPRAIGRKLNRPESSIRGMLGLLGISFRIEEDEFTKYTLSLLLHVRHQIVQEWIDKGWLKAHREGTDRLPRMIIKAKDFVEFCKHHHDAILSRRFNEDRLDFIHKFVFPRDHMDLLKVRGDKKERLAHAERMAKKPVKSHQEETASADVDREAPGADEQSANLGGKPAVRRRAGRAS